MTRTTTLASLIAAGLLATTPALASQWNGNGDIQGSILNDHGKSSFVGTSLAAGKSRFDPYRGAFAGNADLDQSGFAVGNAAPEKGHGEQYGWAVYNVTH